MNLKLKKNLTIINTAKKRKIFLITRVNNAKKVNFFKKRGFKIILLSSLSSKKDFNEMFQYVYLLGYCRAFFETGLTFLNVLFKYKLLNILYVIQSNIMLKKIGLNNSSSHYLKKIKLNKKIKINLINDSLYKKEF